MSFSRLARELRIDFEASKSGLSEQISLERYRSKRVVALASTSDRSCEDTTGEGMLEQSFSGLGVLWTEGWHREELEGLRRLWALREEWDRFM